MLLEPEIETLIAMALAEDVGGGDVTALYFVPLEARSNARVVAREPGVAAGVAVAARVYEVLDSSVLVQPRLADGVSFEKGQVLMEISGPTRSVLTGERTMLNFLQRLCGIATLTRRHVEAARPHGAQIWDTRKTTPGWRRLEKAAVKAGGGVNHRMGLHDQVMVKDNHLAAESRLTALQEAIDRLRTERPGTRVQLEADTLDQVRAFLSLRGVDMLLLDNMSCEQLREAVAMNQGRLWLEASGGVTLDNLPNIASTGVNAVSIGALTHSARALDLGLDFD